MINIVCIGKIKEDYLKEGILEYSKRISGFHKFQIKELKEINTPDVSKNIIEEGKEILDNISDNEFVITLEIKGKMIDSIELSSLLSERFTYGDSIITFVIGGSNGLSLDVINRSNYHLSFSKFTFPHQLMRLVLTEQIYRALTIINHKTYHK